MPFTTRAQLIHSSYPPTSVPLTIGPSNPQHLPLLAMNRSNTVPPQPTSTTPPVQPLSTATGQRYHDDFQHHGLKTPDNHSNFSSTEHQAKKARTSDWNSFNTKGLNPSNIPQPTFAVFSQFPSFEKSLMTGGSTLQPTTPDIHRKEPIDFSKGSHATSSDALSGTDDLSLLPGFEHLNKPDMFRIPFWTATAAAITKSFELRTGKKLSSADKTLASRMDIEWLMESYGLAAYIFCPFFEYQHMKIAVGRLHNEICFQDFSKWIAYIRNVFFCNQPGRKDGNEKSIMKPPEWLNLFNQKQIHLVPFYWKIVRLFNNKVKDDDRLFKVREITAPISPNKSLRTEFDSTYATIIRLFHKSLNPALTSGRTKLRAPMTSYLHIEEFIHSCRTNSPSDASPESLGYYFRFPGDKTANGSTLPSLDDYTAADHWGIEESDVFHSAQDVELLYQRSELDELSNPVFKANLSKLDELKKKWPTLTIKYGVPQIVVNAKELLNEFGREVDSFEISSNSSATVNQRK